MKKILLGAIGTLVAGGLAFFAVLQGGWVDVSADTPHSPLLFALIETARETAIARRIRDIRPPADLADEARARRGAGNYDAMCAGCHLSPGAENSEIRKGLYPAPPDLARPREPAGDPGQTAARQFWIVKHGIKGSGMAAWSKGGMGDEDIWDLVAFLQRLPKLSPEAYHGYVESSGGHRHAGLDDGQGGDQERHAPHGHDHSHGGHRH